MGKVEEAEGFRAIMREAREGIGEITSMCTRAVRWVVLVVGGSGSIVVV